MTGGSAMLMLAAVVGLVLQIGILVVLGYGLLRFATKWMQMRRDIEELKLAVRQLRQPR